MKNRPNRFALTNRNEDILLPPMGDLHRDARRVDQARRLEFRDHPAHGSLALRAACQLLDLGVDAAHVTDEATGAVGVGGEAADVGEDNEPLGAGEDGDVAVSRWAESWSLSPNFAPMSSS